MLMKASYQLIANQMKKNAFLVQRAAFSSL